MNGQNPAIIDVSGLPKSVMDHRAPIWWGNLLLLLIETAMFALVIATYLYFRVVDFQHWPPPNVSGVVAQYHPTPDLTFATLNLVVMLISLAPMLWVDRACLRRSENQVMLGL